MEYEERLRVRRLVSPLIAERAWYGLQLDRLRGELPRVNVQAQVALAGVLAMTVGVGSAAPAWSGHLVAAAVFGVVAVAAAGWSLWPVVRGFGVVPYPAAGVEDRVEQERLLLEARLKDVSRVEQILKRKFRAVQVAYASAAAGLLWLLPVAGWLT